MLVSLVTVQKAFKDNFEAVGERFETKGMVEGKKCVEKPRKAVLMLLLPPSDNSSITLHRHRS